jgi:ubiquitin-protein ligase
MAQYQMYFDTLEGEIKYNVDVSDDEPIEDVLRDIMGDLVEKGHVLRGESIGDLKVIWGGREGKELDLSRSLPEQGVHPNDVLRILVEIYEGGSRSLRDIRIDKEWTLVQRLAQLNPDRLEALERGPSSSQEVFRVRLHSSPGIEGLEGSEMVIRNTHTFSFCYPRFYPEIPIECYIEEPLFHPNIKPETGFVCLWEQASSSFTVVQAIARAHAMLAFQMVNIHDVHVMNDAAAEWFRSKAEPECLVPLEWSDLIVHELVDGEFVWLEPGRQFASHPRLS